MPHIISNLTNTQHHMQMSSAPINTTRSGVSNELHKQAHGILTGHLSGSDINLYGAAIYNRMTA